MSFFFRFFTRVADLMILNFLFILCSLPVITIGASSAALYTVTLRMCRSTETYIVKEFFSAFRRNLKQGVVLHIVLLVLFIILVLDLYVLWNIMEYAILFKWLFGMLLLLSVIFLMASTYIYPLLAQFNNTVKGYIRSAIVLSFKHFHYTLMFLLIKALPIAAALMIENALEWEILIFLLIGLSGLSFLESNFFVIIFKQYIPTGDNPAE